MDAGDADEKSGININDDDDDDDDDDDLQLCAKKGVGQRNHRHQATSATSARAALRHQTPRLISLVSPRYDMQTFSAICSKVSPMNSQSLEDA